MVKRKIKRAIKQKQKQNVNVKQNVKVVVGDVKKRKQVRKSSGAKASAKPPMILNISNPQPLNNAYFEYFKKQLNNQIPEKATSLAEDVRLKEKQETEASKAGLLSKINMEPNDRARYNKQQEAKVKNAVKQREAYSNLQNEMVKASLKPVSQRQVAPEPLRPRKQTPQENLMSSIRASVPLTPSVDETQQNIQASLETQQQQYENEMEAATAQTPQQNVVMERVEEIEKRGPGRPKGSRNKTAEERLAEERAKANQPKRGPGRPRKN